MHNIGRYSLTDNLSFCFLQVSDLLSLASATEDIVNRLELSTKPVVVVGPKVKVANAVQELRHFNAALGSGFATLPDAKGTVNETQSHFMGCYWAGLSSPYGVAQVVENSDLVLFVGAVINDYTTVGWTASIKSQSCIQLCPHHVIVCGKHYSLVQLADLLDALALRAPSRSATLTAFHRYCGDKDSISKIPAAPCYGNTIPFSPLLLKEFQYQLQHLIRGNTSIIFECGDSWFIGQQLKLPEGADCHYQMQYGSCGWALGATLGIAIAVGNARRVVTLIGDGAFQMSFQEVSTMIRQRVKATLFLLNNRGYTTDVEILDGPYNDIKSWDYASLVNVLNAGEGEALGLRATTAGELNEAINRSLTNQGLTVIEVVLQRDDCTETLLEFGSKVATANSRP